MGYVETVGTTVIGITCRDQAEIGTAVGVGGSMVSLYLCQFAIFFRLRALRVHIGLSQLCLSSQ
jgi:hypothetical protein